MVTENIKMKPITYKDFSAYFRGLITEDPLLLSVSHLNPDLRELGFRRNRLETFGYAGTCNFLFKSAQGLEDVLGSLGYIEFERRPHGLHAGWSDRRESVDAQLRKYDLPERDAGLDVEVLPEPIAGGLFYRKDGNLVVFEGDTTNRFPDVKRVGTLEAQCWVYVDSTGPDVRMRPALTLKWHRDTEKFLASEKGKPYVPIIEARKRRYNELSPSRRWKMERVLQIADACVERNVPSVLYIHNMWGPVAAHGYRMPYGAKARSRNVRDSRGANTLPSP